MIVKKLPGLCQRCKDPRHGLGAAQMDGYGGRDAPKQKAGHAETSIDGDQLALDQLYVGRRRVFQARENLSALADMKLGGGLMIQHELDAGEEHADQQWNRHRAVLGIPLSKRTDRFAVLGERKGPLALRIKDFSFICQLINAAQGQHSMLHCRFGHAQLEDQPAPEIGIDGSAQRWRRPVAVEVEEARSVRRPKLQHRVGADEAGGGGAGPNNVAVTLAAGLDAAQAKRFALITLDFANPSNGWLEQKTNDDNEKKRRRRRRRTTLVAVSLLFLFLFLCGLWIMKGELACR